MKVKLIKDINKLGIDYIDCYHLINEVKEDWTIINKIKLVSLYLKKDVSQVVVSDINKLFNQIIEVLNSYRPKEVPIYLNYEGKEYVLQENFHKLPAGWYIDSTSVDFEKVPELLPAFAYIEKGMSYAEVDKHDNIINPLKDRAKVFKDNMKISEYLDLTGFFFAQTKEVQAFINPNKSLSNKAKESKPFEWEKIIHFMADEFKKDWKEITSLNIITFKHRLDFLEELIKERSKTIK